MADRIPTPPKPPAMNCWNCRYSGPAQMSDGIVCRKKPGTGVLTMGQNHLGQPASGIAAVWPPVTEHDWCAEYGAKHNS